MLHWHGMLTLDRVENSSTQGFPLGCHVLALQFHPEVDVTAGIERWLTGHAAELAGPVSTRVLRTHAAQDRTELCEAGQKMLAE